MTYGKKIVISFLFLISVFGCERDSFNPNPIFIARVVGYNLNCETCILEFPYDSSRITSIIGRSNNNYFEAINLYKTNFEIGQQIECTVRKTSPNETTACITLYPSLNYKSVYIKDVIDINNLVLNDTLTLAYHNCLVDSDNKFYLCLDSVVNESRCPIGLECFWAGMATVKFKFQFYQGTPEFFYLNTYSENKTIFQGYTFKLVDLKPYPIKDHKIRQADYIAKLLVTKN